MPKNARLLLSPGELTDQLVEVANFLHHRVDHVFDTDVATKPAVGGRAAKRGGGNSAEFRALAPKQIVPRLADRLVLALDILSAGAILWAVATTPALRATI